MQSRMALASVADSEVDPWVFSRKGKQEAVMSLLEGVGASPLIFLKLQESWSKAGHAAREMATVYCVASFY